MSLKEFVKIAVGLREHPKVLQAGDDGGWLFVCAIMWSKEHDTDGFIPAYAIARLTGLKRPGVAVKKLVSAGLLEEFSDGFRIHDYLDHQESSERRSAAGRKGAAARWSANGGREPNQACDPHADRTMDASGSHPDRNANAMRNRNAEEEEEKEKETPPTPSQDFEDWAAHYQLTTDHLLPARTTKAFRAVVASYDSRRSEGYTPDDLKLAIVGAHADDYRRENGYDVAESILRPTKIAALIAQGKLRTGGRNGSISSAQLGERLRGGPAA